MLLLALTRASAFFIVTPVTVSIAFGALIATREPSAAADLPSAGAAAGS